MKDQGEISKFFILTSFLGNPEVNSMRKESFSARTNKASTPGRDSAKTLACSGPMAIKAVAKASAWVAEGAKTDTDTMEWATGNPVRGSKI